MTLKEKIIEEINQADSVQLHLVYDLIRSMNQGRSAQTATIKRNKAYLKAREALKSVKGSLSKDIIEAREDRI